MKEKDETEEGMRDQERISERNLDTGGKDPVGQKKLRMQKREGKLLGDVLGGGGGGDTVPSVGKKGRAPGH